MSSTFRLLALALIAVLVSGCPAPSKSPAPKASAPPQAASPAASLPALTGEITDETHSVICGCLIKEVGHCAEFMVLDGRHVEIVDHGKGSMPFCGKGRDLKAKLSGTYVDGKLKASKLEILAK